MPAEREFESIILEEIRELKASLQSLERLVACELYGANGREGIKQRLAVLWSEREAQHRWRLAVVGAVLSGVSALVVSVLRWLWKI